MNNIAGFFDINVNLAHTVNHFLVRFVSMSLCVEVCLRLEHEYILFSFHCIYWVLLWQINALASDDIFRSCLHEYIKTYIFEEIEISKGNLWFSLNFT